MKKEFNIFKENRKKKRERKIIELKKQLPKNYNTKTFIKDIFLLSINGFFLLKMIVFIPNKLISFYKYQ